MLRIFARAVLLSLLSPIALAGEPAWKTELRKRLEETVIHRNFNGDTVSILTGHLAREGFPIFTDLTAPIFRQNDQVNLRAPCSVARALRNLALNGVPHRLVCGMILVGDAESIVLHPEDVPGAQRSPRVDVDFQPGASFHEAVQFFQSKGIQVRLSAKDLAERNIRLTGKGVHALHALAVLAHAIRCEIAPQGGAWLVRPRYDWRFVARGLLTGIEDRQKSARHIANAAAWETFRNTHQRLEGRDQRTARGTPLPPYTFNFTDRDLVIVWSGTMYRTLDLLSVQPGAIEARENRPDFDENQVQRMLGAGHYLLISIPRSPKPVTVRWNE